MTSHRRAWTHSSIALLVLACTPDPPLDDEADTIADEADSTDESDTTADEADTTDGSDTGGACQSPDAFGGYPDWSVTIDGAHPGLADIEDLARSCTTVDDGDELKLSLDCGDLTFELSWSPVGWSEAIVDVAGASVQLRFVYVEQWGYEDQWLRLDFVDEDLGVFLIAAEELSALDVFNPWGLAVGQQCEASDLHGLFNQALVLERDDQTLELWAGESGQIGDELEVWIDQSFRYPELEHIQSWRELVIVSRATTRP